MRYYESLYIINPNYEQDRLDEVIKMIAEKVGEYGFSIINQHVWGKKRLAYSIQKHKYGTFVQLHFETETVENLDRFERFMILQKPILRNQTVVLETRPEIKVDEEPVHDETIETPAETPQVEGDIKEEPFLESALEDAVETKEISEEETIGGINAESESNEEVSAETAEEQIVEAKETEEVQE